MSKFNSLILSSTLIFVTTTLLNAQKVYEDTSNVYTKTIKQNGVIKKITISKKHYRSNAHKYGLIIKFTDIENLDIEDFEAKYDLKFKEKLSIGYYIFENLSSLSDLDLIEKIIESEKNLYTIKQNQPLNPKML
jgi:hypothetical protein